jgi:peptidoglycan/xylan/chitin deacetylase (PgdA/CDA1 family)
VQAVGAAARSLLAPTHYAYRGKAGAMLIATTFHYIRHSFDHPYPGIHGITPHELEHQLALLSSVGQFVSAGQIREAIRGGTPLPDRAFVATFDDGLREQYETAWPVLQRMGIPGLFFVNTAPILRGTISSVHKIHLIRASFDPCRVTKVLHEEAARQGIAMNMSIDDANVLSQYKYDDLNTARLKYLLNFLLAPTERDRLVDACFQQLFADNEGGMSKELYMEVSQIRELSEAGCLGTHTHEHLPLGVLPTNLAQEQIELSMAHLNEWTGQHIYALSYPYGSREACSVETGRLAEEAGIEFAFTMERAANADLRTPMFLARFSSSDLPGGNASQWGTRELFDSVPFGSWHDRQARTSRVAQ